jgi:hypothetical protein
MVDRWSAPFAQKVSIAPVLLMALMKALLGHTLELLLPTAPTVKQGISVLSLKKPGNRNVYLAHIL